MKNRVAILSIAIVFSAGFPHLSPCAVMRGFSVLQILAYAQRVRWVETVLTQRHYF